MLRLTFLGTSAAAPTIQRNLSGLAVRRERELFLVDCGEGTQRQMIRYGSGFDVDAIFFTWVVPLAIMTTFPARALLGKDFGPANAASALLGAVAFAAVSRLIWLRSIGRYTSASS